MYFDDNPKRSNYFLHPSSDAFVIKYKKPYYQSLHLNCTRLSSDEMNLQRRCIAIPRTEPHKQVSSLHSSAAISSLLFVWYSDTHGLTNTVCLCLWSIRRLKIYSFRIGNHSLLWRDSEWQHRLFFFKYVKDKLILQYINWVSLTAKIMPTEINAYFF